MKVSSIMTREVISVKPEEKIIDVADLLHRKGLNGVPVVSEGKVLGMITEADLICRGSSSFHIPSLIRFFQEFSLEKQASGRKRGDFHLVFEADAGSIMNTEFISIGPDSEITELVSLFQEKHVNPIPVIDEEKRLLGVVSFADILKIISRFREVEFDFLSSGQ